MPDGRLPRRETDGTLVCHADPSAHISGQLNDMMVDSHGRAFVGEFGFDLMSGADLKPACCASILTVRHQGRRGHVAPERQRENRGRHAAVDETFGNRVTAFDIAEEECLKPVDVPGRGVPSRMILRGPQARPAGSTPAGKVYPVSTIIPDLSAMLPAGVQESSLIDQIVREGARRMLAAALQAEVEAYIDQFAGELDQDGRGWWSATGRRTRGRCYQRRGGRGYRAAGQRQAHRPGHWRAAAVLLSDPAAVGPQDSAGQRGAAAAVPARPVLAGLRARARPVLGSSLGLSGPVITRLTSQWTDEAKAFAARDLSAIDYVYVWADGIHVKIRLGEEVVPAGDDRGPCRRPQRAHRPGRRVRESSDSWPACCGTAPATACRPGPGHGRRRSASGRRCAKSSPEPGKSAAGSIRSPTCSARCRNPRTPAPKKALAEIWNAETNDHARKAVRRSRKATASKTPRPRPRSTAMRRSSSGSSIIPPSTGGPAHHEPHRVHLRSVRHRTKVTKGPGSKTAGIAMAFKLFESAERPGAS